MASLAEIVQRAKQPQNGNGSESNGHADAGSPKENGDGAPPVLVQQASDKEDKKGKLPQPPQRQSSLPHPTRQSSLDSGPIPRSQSARNSFSGPSPGMLTPSGPPRSLSYFNSRPAARFTSLEQAHSQISEAESEDRPETWDWTAHDQPERYRDAINYNDPEQREREREAAIERRNKRNSSSVWDVKRWLPESRSQTPRGSPTEEKKEFNFSDSPRIKQGPSAAAGKKERVEEENSDEVEEISTEGARASQSANPVRRGSEMPTSGVTSPRQGSFWGTLRKARSMPHMKEDADGRADAEDEHEKKQQRQGGGTNKDAHAKWNRLRFLLPHIAQQGPSPGASAINPVHVNITDELMASGLSVILLRLWMERDERGQRRVPVLLHRLRIRISDSLHPLHGAQSVFRIECEYANGAVRWVIYRQLRDFLSLHAHYTVSNAYNRNVEAMPEFPKTSLPYFKFLQKENKKDGKQKDGGKDVARADFARMQRETLENYLVGLIRAVMFHPAANRLCGFLEISALSIHLAPTGGAQYKAGFVRIKSSGTRGPSFGRRGTGRKDKLEQKWCAVRESYLVAVDDPGELAIFDVFMLDSEFRIERPTRYYRQGLNLLQGEMVRDEIAERKHLMPPDDHHERSSMFSSIRRSFSKVVHPRHSHDTGHTNGDAHARPSSARTSSDSSSSSSSSSSSDERPATPMLDPSTNTNPIADDGDQRAPGGMDGKKKKKSRMSSEMSKHTFYIVNSQMRLKLFARSERQMLQWIAALEKVAATSHYTGTNRFDSFAPIRLNVAAQWLVDGRDYYWNLSRAILLAKETIYIHDWWLSPELQLRRPNKPKYQLDNLLKKKAEEGVKIHIIIYQEVSSRTTPVDSNYAKSRLTSLHPNIMVQRSPSHFQTGTFYWSHHEKMCVIDETIAFMGGFDLCFGRWDTPQHSLVDDPDDPEAVIWPGKDYNNNRVEDFHTLNKPFEDMHDRKTTPRMPWHDTGLQILGQPARDLARHFVQRWNHLLRIKNHSREMPFLLPPAEYKTGELANLGLTGTCELQICRSCGPWSMGTPDRIEHSIQNAYLKAIQMSEHFVYIENQFFITSTMVGDVQIENKIGDAIVERIIRAHHEGTKWRCCVVIPLLPGYPFPLDHNDASSVRLILECQNRTIGRGPHSIFSRLRKEGIDPDNYFGIFSLRNWGKLRGDVLTTEQVYIHGKVCIVDDRLAIIGSANINERSQRGDRDSELAAVIRDTDMVDSTMAGEPFKVGRFAHTLRVRLMREHVGIDVDALDEEDLLANKPEKEEHEVDPWDPDAEQRQGNEDVTAHAGHSGRARLMAQFAGDTIGSAAQGTKDLADEAFVRLGQDVGLRRDVPTLNNANVGLGDERKTFTRSGEEVPGFADSVVPTLEEQAIMEGLPGKPARGRPSTRDNEGEMKEEKSDLAPAEASTDNGQKFGAPADASRDAATDNEPPHARSGTDDAQGEERDAPRVRSILRKHLKAGTGGSPYVLPTPRPEITPDMLNDPVSDDCYKQVWIAAAAHNTEIFRKVFHAVPDDLVTTWKQYIEFIAHHERMNKPSADHPEPVGRVPSETGDVGAPGEQDTQDHLGRAEEFAKKDEDPHTASDSGDKAHGTANPTTNASNLNGGGTQKSKKGKSESGEPAFTKQERDEMEALLGELCGHLVIYPTRFLEGEDVANNFLFNTDRLLPLPIYD